MTLTLSSFTLQNFLQRNTLFGKAILEFANIYFGDFGVTRKRIIPNGLLHPCLYINSSKIFIECYYYPLFKDSSNIFLSLAFLYSPFWLRIVFNDFPHGVNCFTSSSITNSTEILVPCITGLPLRISGSHTILLKNFFLHDNPIIQFNWSFIKVLLVSSKYEW